MTALFQRKNLAGIAGGILAIILVGCVSPATQRVAVDPDRLAEEAERQRLIALESMLFDQLRMHRVAFPLLEAASSFAGRRVRPYLGIYYVNRYSFSLRFSETAASHYGLGEALSILEVVPQSGANDGSLDALFRERQ